MESCLIISDIDQAESLARVWHMLEDHPNIIFETTYIKLIFFNVLKIHAKHIKIINCNSSKKRLLRDINNCCGDLVVFDKINYCDDLSIFNLINSIDNRILVC